MDSIKEMDKGKWYIYRGPEGIVKGIASEDFTHDVVLYVSGDFENQDEMKTYCELLAKTLNSL